MSIPFIVSLVRYPPCFVYHGPFLCVNRKRGSVFKNGVQMIVLKHSLIQTFILPGRFFVTYQLLWSTAICCGSDIKCETVPEVGYRKMALYGSSIGCDIKMCTEFRADNLVLTL